MRSVVNATEVWIPSSVPSAIIWVHVVIVWIVESGISIVAIVPRIIETAIPATIVPWVVSVIPRTIVSSIISPIVTTVIAAIVPWVISIVPWVVVASVTPWA
jgi:hypothetical protein